MKHIYSLLILMFISIGAIAQTPGVIDTNVYRINENDVKRFIVAQKSMNLTKTDFEWMKDHPYEAHQDNAIYQRIRKSILSAGFKDYGEYAKVSQRVLTVYGYGESGGLNEAQITEMEDAVNNPDIPEQYKTMMREQLQSFKKQQPTPTETQSVAPHLKELEAIFAKFTEEG